jgi:pyruvate kinase
MKQINNNRTKVIATIGPSSSGYDTLKEMIINGVDVVRLNFSHGDYKDHKETILNVRKISDELGLPVSVLQDIQGPKIRVGKLNKDKIQLNEGHKFFITSDNIIGNIDEISIDNNIISDIKENERILIDDGKIELRVIKKEKNKVKVEVKRGGVLLQRKGVNFPESDIKLSSLTEKDVNDLLFGLKNNVDWVALSFVRSEDDIIHLRKLIKKNGYNTKIIAKIEKPQAIKNIDKIIIESDGLMVARGDLGVEMPMESVPIIQKKIVFKCNLACKPVIIATQMLESMVSQKTPTRAESNDVANAVLDGADAVMLSAESATGDYPLLAVESMNRIINSVEKTSDTIYYKFEKIKKLKNKLSESLITTACRLSKQISAKAIITMTKSGYSAFRVSGNRPKARIYIVTNDKKIGNVLNLVWGVRSIYYDKTENIDATLENIESILVNNNHLSKNDRYIITSSMPTHWKGHTNMMKVNIVEL